MHERRKRSILIVDDEFGLAEVLAEILGELDHRVRISVNGKLGLEAVAEERPDIVLLDVMMPLLDGPRMLEILKSDPELEKIPVVMMTSAAEALPRPPRYQAALTKPFTPDQLIELINRLLGP